MGSVKKFGEFSKINESSNYVMGDIKKYSSDGDFMYIEDLEDNGIVYDILFKNDSYEVISADGKDVFIHDLDCAYIHDNLIFFKSIIEGIIESFFKGEMDSMGCNNALETYQFVKRLIGDWKE